MAALGAQAPLLSQYPARGPTRPRARKRAAYRLAQSIRFQQFYAVLMDALEDTCGNEIPSVSAGEVWVSVVQSSYFTSHPLNLLYSRCARIAGLCSGMLSASPTGSCTDTMQRRFAKSCGNAPLGSLTREIMCSHWQLLVM